MQKLKNIYIYENPLREFIFKADGQAKAHLNIP